MISSSKSLLSNSARGKIGFSVAKSGHFSKRATSNEEYEPGPVMPSLGGVEIGELDQILLGCETRITGVEKGSIDSAPPQNQLKHIAT